MEKELEKLFEHCKGCKHFDINTVCVYIKINQKGTEKWKKKS